MTGTGLVCFTAEGWPVVAEASDAAWIATLITVEEMATTASGLVQARRPVQCRIRPMVLLRSAPRAHRGASSSAQGSLSFSRTLLLFDGRLKPVPPFRLQRLGEVVDLARGPRASVFAVSIGSSSPQGAFDEACKISAPLECRPFNLIRSKRGTLS